MSLLISKPAFFAIACTLLMVSTSSLSAQCSGGRPIYGQPVYGRPVYSQPIYSQPVYSQPVKTLTTAEAARMYTNDAKVLFKQGKYREAKAKLNEVVQRAPKDTNAYQFRAMASFAAANFDDAAADAYDSLRLGNAWTQPVIQSLYGEDLTPYKTHLSVLARVVETKPSMQSHFLMAYHHLMNAEWAAGKDQLEKVLALQKDEPLSTQLLAAVNAKLSQTENAVGQAGN